MFAIIWFVDFKHKTNQAGENSNFVQNALLKAYPVDQYIFKVNNKTSIPMCHICSKLVVLDNQKRIWEPVKHLR